MVEGRKRVESGNDKIKLFSSPEHEGWLEVVPSDVAYRGKTDNWKTRLKKQTGYMPRPLPIKIHPDRKRKRVMAKVLYNAGWSSRMLSIWFKVPTQRITRWKDIPTPEHLMEFQKNFELAMKDYDDKALYLTKERMMEIIPEEKDLNKLVKTAEFFRGVTPKNQTNIQNNLYGDLVKKFAIDSDEK